MTRNTNQLIQETMESYYEYVVKIEGGCNSIIELLKNIENEKAMQGIAELSDGLDWLLQVENQLKMYSFTIESPISEISLLFQNINIALEKNDLENIKSLIELELKPLFVNAQKWKFEEVVN